MKATFWFVLFLIIGHLSQAQELPPAIERQLESLAEQTQSEVQDEGYIYELEYLRKHPLDINSATESDLKRLHLLTEIQINNLIAYKKSFGKLIDIHELQSVPGWDLFTINNVIGYITVNGNTALLDNLLSGLKGKKELVFQGSRVLERSIGYDTSKQNHFLGDPNRVVLRFTNRYKDIFQFGITATKDAGEPFKIGSGSQGFDFYSFHLFVKGTGMLKSLAIGDYTVNLGQGLIQWQSFGAGKSSDVLMVKKESPVIMPYKGLNEINFRRGTAITLQKGNWEANFFGSIKKISTHFLSDSSDVFTSIYTSGLHRTSSEISSKNGVTMFSVGGAISFSTGPFKASFNMVKDRFSDSFEKRKEPYNYFVFSGKDLFNTSIDYTYNYHNMIVFGEVASDKNYHKGFLSGAIISVDPKMEVSILYRNISEKYQSLSGKAFTENSIPVNESGFYMGIALKPGIKWQIKAYADLYHKPYLSYRVSSPVNGSDFLMSVHYSYDRSAEIYGSYRAQVKPVDSTGAIIPFPELPVHKSIQINILYKFAVGRSLKLKGEKLWNTSNNKSSNGGFLIYLEESRKIFHVFRTHLRLQYFNANSGNPIYSYTGFTALSAYVPAFYNKGLFYQAEIVYSASKRVGLKFNWIETIYLDKEKIGSGLDLINGNKRSEIKMELKYAFL